METKTVTKKRGGFIPGAGRKPGAKNKKTLLLEDAYKAVQQKLIERSMSLINTQTVIAHGTIKIYVIPSHWEGTGKNKKKVRGKPELVTDDETIARVIDYKFGDGDNPSDDDDEYYFVSTQDPDNKAIESQINRIFGKAQANIDVTSGGKEVKQITGMQIVDEAEDESDV